MSEINALFNTAQRMDFFAEANSQLIAGLPLAVELFGKIKPIITQLEQAGISRTSSTTEGVSATRSKAGIFNALYEDLREIAGTASIIKKNSSAIDNKFILSSAKMNYQEAIERGKAFFADSESPAVIKLFTDRGLEDDFREDLIENVNALIESTQTQTDAKRAGVGHTAQINALLEEFMDIRETLKRVMKNLLKNNPQKLGEWNTAVHIERKKYRKSKPTE